MLLLQSKIIGMPIGSVQAGHRVGEVIGFVINPRGLKIAALLVDSPISVEPLFLHVEDILETRFKGVLIDHNEQLMEDEDLVRLNELQEIDFHPINMKVQTEKGKKVGSVVDFTVNTDGWTVHQIQTQPSAIKFFTQPDRMISRNQISKVTKKMIVVKDGNQKQTASKSHSREDAKRMALAKLRPKLAQSVSSRQD